MGRSQQRAKFITPDKCLADSVRARLSDSVLLYLPLKVDRRSQAGDFACEENFTSEATSQMKHVARSDSLKHCAQRGQKTPIPF